MSRQRETTTLWRPTGPVELELVRESGWRAWPPRLPEQPIFYPVLIEAYAVKIARDWNVKHDGAGYVTRFEVEAEFLRRYPVRQAGWGDDSRVVGAAWRSLPSSTRTSWARSRSCTSSDSRNGSRSHGSQVSSSRSSPPGTAVGWTPAPRCVRPRSPAGPVRVRRGARH